MGHAHSAPVLGTTPNESSTPKAQDNNELAEMRAMFKKMKALTEKNSAFMEKFVEYSRFEQGDSQLAMGQGEGDLDEHPDLDSQSRAGRNSRTGGNGSDPG